MVRLLNYYEVQNSINHYQEPFLTNNLIAICVEVLRKRQFENEVREAELRDAELFAYLAAQVLEEQRQQQQLRELEEAQRNYEELGAINQRSAAGPSQKGLSGAPENPVTTFSCCTRFSGE